MTPEQKLERARAYASVFLNDDGSMKPEGEIVLRDIEALCGWMQTGLPMDGNQAVDPYASVAALAKRSVFADIKKRVFADFAALKRKTED